MSHQKQQVPGHALLNLRRTVLMRAECRCGDISDTKMTQSQRGKWQTQHLADLKMDQVSAAEIEDLLRETGLL